MNGVKGSRKLLYETCRGPPLSLKAVASYDILLLSGSLE